MANRFDKYLQRLYARRISTPELDSYRNLSRGMAPTVKSIEFATKGGIREAGGSIGAQAQLGLRSQQTIQSAATDRFGIASREAGARNAVLDQQIDQVTMQRDAEREAGKDSALKTALNVGGTLAGAAIGTIVAPGAGTMLGAKLGSSLGQIGSGFVGGGGEMGMEYADPAQITQGIADIAMSISSASVLKEQKDMAMNVGRYISANMGDETKLEAMRLAIMIGPEAVDKLFSTVGSPELPDFEISGNNGSGTEAQMKAQMQAQLDSLMQGITNQVETNRNPLDNPGAQAIDTNSDTPGYDAETPWKKGTEHGQQYTLPNTGQQRESVYTDANRGTSQAERLPISQFNSNIRMAESNNNGRIRTAYLNTTGDNDGFDNPYTPDIPKDTRTSRETNFLRFMESLRDANGERVVPWTEFSQNRRYATEPSGNNPLDVIYFTNIESSRAELDRMIDLYKSWNNGEFNWSDYENPIQPGTAVSAVIEQNINASRPHRTEADMPESQNSAAQNDPADALYYQNGDSRVQFSNQAPVGNHRVGQGQLFSRRVRDGVLLIKVNGIYKVLRRADNSPIQVRAGQQVTVNEDGTITVGGE